MACNYRLGVEIMQPIFFDLDGTLTDPKEGITGCIQYAMEKLGEPAPSKDDLTWCIGPSLIHSFDILVGAERSIQAVEFYRERFSTVGLFENIPYADIAHVLGTLKSAGHPLFVASSKPLVFVDRILKHFDLFEYFQTTFGSNLDGTLADKSELLAHALNTTGFVGSDCLMIGDRMHDAQGAASNGMDFIGALYGYGNVAEYQQHGFSCWVESPRDLLEMIGS
jgi:phosphoglycolate phosphatase